MNTIVDMMGSWGEVRLDPPFVRPFMHGIFNESCTVGLPIQLGMLNQHHAPVVLTPYGALSAPRGNSVGVERVKSEPVARSVCLVSLRRPGPLLTIGLRGVDPVSVAHVQSVVPLQ